MLQIRHKNPIADQGESAEIKQTQGIPVVGVSVRGITKNVRFTKRSGKPAVLAVHRFAVVGKKDRLAIGNGLERRVCVEGESDTRIPLLPMFSLHGKHRLGELQVDTRVVELSTESDFRDYVALEGFHYRGLDLSQRVQEFGVQRKGTGGRRAVLLLQIKIAEQWRSAGYVELQMPLMMAKPRHAAFARPFRHPTLPVSWESWAKGGQNLVNRIARIARVVVNPELRGASFSGVLVNAAVAFARERWHIGGKRALFLEISAINVLDSSRADRADPARVGSFPFTAEALEAVLGQLTFRTPRKVVTVMQQIIEEARLADLDPTLGAFTVAQLDESGITEEVL